MILIIYNDKFPKIYVKISAKITFQPRCIHTHTTPYLNIHEILNRLGRSGIFRILSGSNPSNLARGEIAATHMGTGHYLKHRAGCCWVTSSGQPQQNTLPLCKAEENFAEPGSRQLVVYHASCNLFACVSLSLSLFPFAGSSSFFFRAGWLTQLTGASNEWCVCVCVYMRVVVHLLQEVTCWVQTAKRFRPFQRCGSRLFHNLGHDKWVARYFLINI